MTPTPTHTPSARDLERAALIADAKRKAELARAARRADRAGVVG